MKKERKWVVIIDEENSVLGRLIRDNFIHSYKRTKTGYKVISLSLEDAEHLISEYQIKEFPCILYFREQKLVNMVCGYKYEYLKVA